MLRSLLITACLLIAGRASAQCPATVTPSSNPVCVNQAFTLTAPTGANSYQWFLSGNQLGTNSNVLTTTNNVAGTQLYTAIIDFGTCIDTVDVSMTVISAPVIIANNNNPPCGGTLLLTSTNCTGCTYQWTGPLGFASTFQNPAISNVQSLHSGVYTVLATLGGCVSLPAATTVTIGPSVIANSSGAACIGDTLYLTSNTINNATYHWTGPGGFNCYQEDTSFIVDNTTEGGIYILNVAENWCTGTDTAFVTVCNTIQLNYYYDLNNNCSFDTGDYNAILPILSEIDSNGIAIDTVSTTSGLYYIARGQAGDIYSFKILSQTGDLTATCPLTGIIDFPLQTLSYSIIEMGIGCGTSSNFDLGMSVSSRAGIHLLDAYIYPGNLYCMPQNAILTMNYDQSYSSFNSSPSPSSQSAGVATWNLNNLSATDAPIPIHVTLDGAMWPVGTPISTTYTITPVTNDQNPINNTLIKTDTATGGYDPNEISVTPEECVTAGTKLQYNISFENLGNGPAENIHVMDTLPSGVDANTMELLFSSHTMFVEKINDGGHTILKFSFPDIWLPDSSDHVGRHGMFAYNINTNSNLPYGALIGHRAGIYFDFNPVVLTNTAQTTICVPNDVSKVTGNGNILLYPNPAGEELTVQADETFSACTITNTIGQVMLQQPLTGKQTTLDIRSLAPGIYYMSVKGEGVSEVVKFVKM